jgi:D-alanyl-D-alanine carboxypeptidase (penicillin-binding protein 5/6)
MKPVMNAFMKRSMAVLLSVLLAVVSAPCVYVKAVEAPLLYTETEAQDDNQTEAQDDSQSEEQTEEQTNKNTLQISAPSAILMEVSTGQIIYEKEADNELPPASVTKIMTLLLIFDALESGKIHLEDEVTTSEYAASMGGSQVYLEAGETQTVDTMIKCIAVASANDACVAYR